MDRELLKTYSQFNEEKLSFIDRLMLQKMCKSDVQTVVKIFNRIPAHLKKYELVYFAKYLSKNYGFYINDDKVYIGPNEANEKELTEFFVPSGCEKVNVDEFYKENKLGYRNLRVYNVIPGIKYKLMKGHTLTGYPSQDKPWDLISEKVNIKSNNLLDFYNNSRKFLGPKKCKYAYECYDQKVTWEEFETMIEQYTKALSAYGVKKGDVIPICITSRIEAVALYFANDAIGATTFFIDPNETNVEAMHKYFERFNPKITFANCKDLEKVNEASTETSITKIITLSPSDSMKMTDELCEYSKEFIKNNTVPFEENDKVKSMDTFINDGIKNTDNIEYCYDNSNISLITSTSASTGEPKLIELSRENIMFELESIKRTTNINLGPNGVNMQVVPFKYPYGFIVSTLITPYVGKTGGLTPDLSLQNYVKFFDMYKPTYLHTVPSFIKNMTKNPELQDRDMSFLKFVISGGDKYETSAKEKANKWFEEHNSQARVKDASGAAEVTAGQTAATVGKYNVESVGKPLRGTIVKTVDENGNELPYGHVGKLMYSGPNVMQRYNNDSEKTSEVKVYDNNGQAWILTDSYGFVDSEGFVYMCGRDRDFFITYPKNKPPFKVYVEYIEKTINSCEEVFDSVVVKKPDDESDFVPKAYIVLKPDINEKDYDSVLEKIKNKCISELDSCAIPTSFDILPSLKVKSSMKTDKAYYTELAQEEYEKEKNKEGKEL